MPFQIDGRGDMNAFVLTSPLAGVMLLTRRQPFYPSAAHDKFYSICTAFGGYTEFGIVPNLPFALQDEFQCVIIKIPSISRMFCSVRKRSRILERSLELFFVVAVSLALQLCEPSNTLLIFLIFSATLQTLRARFLQPDTHPGVFSPLPSRH